MRRGEERGGGGRRGEGSNHLSQVEDVVTYSHLF